MDDPPHLMGLEGVEEPRNVVELSLDGRDAGTRREGVVAVVGDDRLPPVHELVDDQPAHIPAAPGDQRRRHGSGRVEVPLVEAVEDAGLGQHVLAPP